ncbi:MAG: IS630 family transposase [Anaerolineae bacterium]|nr:IS630 family transposase [Anaerolineae bacterium]
MRLGFLDEVGFSLSLPPTYTWSHRGSHHRLRVPTRWGSHGRINAIGTLWLGEEDALSYRLLEGTVTSVEVIAFIDEIAVSCTPGNLTVVVLDNAGFHKSKLVQERRSGWEERGLFLRYLPPYCPFLNPIEGLWKRVKAFLLPRRCYASVTDLRQAVLAAFAVLGAVKVHSE